MTNLRPIIEDTTLTMIVRDEIMNPAGGLLAVLDKHASFYPEIVVLDTGSVDGTRELLEHLESTYPNLMVFDHKFNGYGPSRQVANSHVRTKYTLILDADELLLEEDTLQISTILSQRSDFSALSIPNYLVLPRKKPRRYGPGNPTFYNRLLVAENVQFKGDVYEIPTFTGNETKTEDARILHFKAGMDSVLYKITYWYLFFDNHMENGTSPSQLEESYKWKTPDPFTLKQYGIDIYDIIDRLEKIGLSVPDDIKDRIPSGFIGKFFYTLTGPLSVKLEDSRHRYVSHTF